MADAAHQRIPPPRYSEVIPSRAGFTRTMCSVEETGGCLAVPDVLFSFVREGGTSEEFELSQPIIGSSRFLGGFLTSLTASSFSAFGGLSLGFCSRIHKGHRLINFQHFLLNPGWTELLLKPTTSCSCWQRCEVKILCRDAKPRSTVCLQQLSGITAYISILFT